MRIIVEGWRFTPQSYAIVNQFQCLELLRRSHIQLFHRDMLYHGRQLPQVMGLFDPAAEEALQRLSAPADHQVADITLRLYSPFNLAPSQSAKTGVFMTSEWGYIHPVMLDLAGWSSLKEAHANSDIILVTPSHWSKLGLVNSGATADRVAIVPHGVDPTLYHPPTPEVRQQLRQEMGLEDCFVFLHIGAMSDNKAIDLLLKAFAIVSSHYPHARLLLKGMDLLYNSKDLLMQATHLLTSEEANALMERVIYFGQPFSFAEMATLYQAADAYVSPYVAEGFNMPVLEAIACGLPVICTAGGPTDDFTQPEFALRIDSTTQAVKSDAGEPGIGLVPDPDHLIALMQAVIEFPDIGEQARQTGPEFVQNQFTWKHSVDLLLEALSPATLTP